MAIEPITRLNIEKPKRTCKHCEIQKELTDFYSNSRWEDKNGKDVWCRDCVKGIRTKDEVRQYFWENNRKWKDKIWADARAKADELLLNNAIFKKADAEKQQVIIEQTTCEQIPLLMNKPMYYEFDDHENKKYEEAKMTGAIEDIVDEGSRQYDLDWDGYYTVRELDFLNNFYDKMTKDQDELEFAQEIYIRNWAKSVMNLNKAQDALLRGEGSIEDVQKASAVMDTLGKTGQLAPKKKEDKTEAMNSVSEISLYLIQHGHPMTRKIEWPQDSTDYVLAQFGYLPVSLGLQDLN